MNIDNFRSASTAAAHLLKALANERRLLIVCELGRGEQSVSQLEARIGLRQSALSQHLARLRNDGIVRTRRQSRTVFYSLVGGEARAIVETLHGLYCTTASGMAGYRDRGAEPGPGGRDPDGGPS